MVAVAKELLRTAANVSFTFAGDGSDREWIAEQFRDCPRVTVQKYPSDAMHAVHLKHDISVVPSLGSEGTTLSVVEAMGAGCVVVASPVGGITNMVIDGFNGLLVAPTTQDVSERLRELLNNRNERIRLAETGYQTASSAFSIASWKRQWRRVLEHVARL